MADLIIEAYFFAMRSCEYAIPKEIGKTITIRLGGVTFFNIQQKEIDQTHRHLLHIAVHVRLLFEDQKNREKCEIKLIDDQEMPSYVPSSALVDPSNEYKNSPRIQPQTPCCAL